jgi:hypothetical protein
MNSQAPFLVLFVLFYLLRCVS